MFNPINFSDLNETDVREEILAPLIKYLGYRSGTNHNVIREQSLRYPNVYIGRKNPNNDPILRGKADYILEAARIVRWVIEAKAPDVALDNDTIEQAYTYANHPEVRAVYFVLSNGKSLLIFQTNRGPNAPPIFEIQYEELNDHLETLRNLLGPEAILRDHPGITPDIGTPLGPNLRSFARITNGLIKQERNSLGIPALSETQTWISSGAIERDERGRLIVFINTVSSTRSIQALNERLGLTSFEMLSADHEISTQSATPTILSYERTIMFPAGEELFDLNTWHHITLPTNLTCHVIARASGTLSEKRFSGKFQMHMDMNFPNKPSIPVITDGSFEIHLS